MDERIKTLHPEAGKQGVRILKDRYDQVRQAILSALVAENGLTLDELSQAVAARLPPDFDGSVTWYTVTVKLDLEARGEIERTGSRPHRVRLKDAPK